MRMLPDDLATDAIPRDIGPDTAGPEPEPEGDEDDEIEPVAAEPEPDAFDDPEDDE